MRERQREGRKEREEKVEILPLVFRLTVVSQRIFVILFHETPLVRETRNISPINAAIIKEEIGYGVGYGPLVHRRGPTDMKRDIKFTRCVEG